MRQGKDRFSVRIVALSAIMMVAAWPQTTWSASASSSAPADNRPPNPPRALQVSDLHVSSELGYILETHRPSTTSASSAPIVVHIQEAHTNLGAQRNLIGILEQLVKEHGLKLILVEGGDGDVGLSYLRSYGPPENRKQVAEKYLKTGIISAEEYLDIVSDYPLILWGVEQEALYQDNVNAFLKTESLRNSLGPVLASVRQSAQMLKPKLFDPALDDLQTKSEAFDQGSLKLADYVDALNSLVSRQNGSDTAISEKTFPHLARFLEARRLEKTLQLDQVQQEQRALMQQLSQKAEPAQLDGLLANARLLKEGKLKREEFYERLEQVTTASGLSLEASQNLSRYVRYLTRSAAINPTELSKELDRLAAALRASLASTPESRALQALLDRLDLLEKLLGLRLAPEEHTQLQSVDIEATITQWSGFLSTQLTRQGLPTLSLGRLSELKDAIPTLQRFYEAANRRDDVLVERAMAKLADTKEPIAVLITGGFHSPRITQMLIERGVSVVVVAPKVDEETNDQLYRAVLKYKSGHGSFEEVQALANGQ